VFTYKSIDICVEDRIAGFFGAKFSDEAAQLSTIFFFAVISEKEKKRK